MELGENPNITEVLWNFSRLRDPKKRLTLKQNPHFYEHLPRVPEKYTTNFRCDPIKDLSFRHRQIYVLTDRPRRIYLDAGLVPRAFGNIWLPHHAFIFQGSSDSFLIFSIFTHFYIFADVCGKLEGEEIVWASIKKKSESPTSPDTVDGKSFQDWRDSIRRSWRSPDPDVGNTRGNTRIVHCAIDSANDDALLCIFRSYRLDDDENWNLQRRWCKLIHVCRRWRHLILGSPSHLNLHLLCTNGTPVVDMLNNSPPLPIMIKYQNACPTMTPKDEEGVLFALQRHDRVRRVVLHVPFQALHRFLAAMNEHFPTLERLSILPTTDGNVGLVIPRTFQAPRLSHLALLGVTLFGEPRSLASTVSLIVLTLTIPWVFVYLPPEDLAVQLQFVPLLKELSVIFSVPIPRTFVQKRAMFTPITRATLHSLKRLVFRGPSAYLEGLLARINTPCLRNFDVTLFNQLIFDLPVLSKFISAAAEPRFPSVKVNFNQNIISISICNHNKSFYVRVSCMPFDWQVRSAAQICSALGRTLPGVEELSLDFYEHGLPPEWRNKVDSRTWCELVRPFKGVEKLCVAHALALDLSRMLQPEEEPSEPLLPVLKELEVEEGCEDNAFTAFIDARQRLDCPIQLVVCPSMRKPDLGVPPAARSGAERSNTETEKALDTKHLTTRLRTIVPSF